MLKTASLKCSWYIRKKLTVNADLSEKVRKEIADNENVTTTAMVLSKYGMKRVQSYLMEQFKIENKKTTQISKGLSWYLNQRVNCVII